MALTYKANGGSADYKTVPSGTHIAVCNLIADLGLQPGSAMYPNPKHQVYIRFEVPSERVEYEKDGRKHDGPVVIGMTFTASMHEKANLRKQLESWRGRRFGDEEAEAFDIASILSKGCMLSVVEKVKGDKVYSNIQSISGLPKGIKAGEPEIAAVLYGGEADDTFDDLPEWIQNKIQAQIRQSVPSTRSYEQASTEITDDDIPF